MAEVHVRDMLRHSRTYLLQGNRRIISLITWTSCITYWLSLTWFLSCRWLQSLLFKLYLPAAQFNLAELYSSKWKLYHQAYPVFKFVYNYVVLCACRRYDR